MKKQFPSSKPRTYGKDPGKAASWGKPAKRCPWKMASYHGMIKCIDDNVGKLIAALKERNLYDNTILVFTADHGDMRGEHGLQNKGYPMEASARIPFVIRYPAQIEGGQLIRRAMNTTDFCPTILAMTGCEATGREEGTDLSAEFSGGKASGDNITFSRSTTKSVDDESGWVAAITPTHKLILSEKDEPWLIDLEKDPDELVNFAGNRDYAETAKYLAGQLSGYGERTGDAKVRNAKNRAALEAMSG